MAQARTKKHVTTKSTSTKKQNATPKRKTHIRSASDDGIFQRSGREGYFAEWTDARGKRVQRKLMGAHTLKQARAVLEHEKRKVEEQLRYGKPVLTEDSFAEFAEEFLAFQKKRITSRVIKGKLSEAEYIRQRGIIEKYLKPFFGQAKLAAIRKSDVAAYIHKRTGEASDGTIIKEMNVLKRLFNIAIEFDKIEANPAHKPALMPKAPEGRVRYLSPEELSMVLKACPDWLRPIAGLAVALGTRRGELLAVRGEDIDLKAGTIMLRKTKNGKTRPAFINDLASQVLTSMGVEKHKRRGLLFPNVTPGQVSVAFVRSCRDAGIEDFSFHDLRHTFASHARMNGADLHDLQKLLGHGGDGRMTARYAHLSDDHLAKAARRLDGVLTLPAIAPEHAGEKATKQAGR